MPLGNLLRNIPFSGHLLVLGLLLLLRLPAFFSGYFLPSESLYLVCAEKIAGGGSLYIDAWYEGPPLVIWLYSLFSVIFGNSALTAIRVFTLVYLFFTITYFQSMLVEYKVFKKDQIAPALLLVLLTSTPWSQLELTPSLLFLWPALFSFHVIILLTLAKRRNFRRLFFAGGAMMLCLMMDYSALGLMLGLALAYFMIRQPQVQEFFTLLLGSGIALVLVGFGLYYTDSVMEFFDIGLRQYVSQILEKSAPPFARPLSNLLITAGLSWGFVVFLAALGFAHFRVKIFSYVIVIRRVEQAMAIWLFSGFLILFLSGSKLAFHDFVVLGPPLAFYAAKSWYFSLPRFLNLSKWALLFASPLYMALLWIALVFPPRLEGMRPASMTERLGITCHLPSQFPRLKSYVEEIAPSANLWVLANKPELYLFLERDCGPVYTDFRVVYHKLPYFSQKIPRFPEPDGAIYEQFKQNAPDMVLEPPGQEMGFLKLKQRFPTVLGNYRLDSNKPVDGFLIWEKK